MSEGVSLREKGSVSTLFSLGFKTVRRPRYRESDEWRSSEGEQLKRRKCVPTSSYSYEVRVKPKKLDKKRKLRHPDHSLEQFSVAKDYREEAMEVPGSPYRTPEKQIVSNRVETVPATPRKQFHNEVFNVLKEWPVNQPCRVGACASCGRLTKLRNSVPICLRLDCALQYAQLD